MQLVEQGVELGLNSCQTPRYSYCPMNLKTHGEDDMLSLGMMPLMHVINQPVYLTSARIPIHVPQGKARAVDLETE